MVNRKAKRNFFYFINRLDVRTTKKTFALISKLSLDKRDLRELKERRKKQLIS
jgi:hypothetical protein